MQIRHTPDRSLRSIFKWGDPGVFYEIDDRLRAFIRDRLELPPERLETHHHPGLEEIPPLPACGLSPETLGSLADIVGPENVSTTDEARARHATGATFLDAMRLRLGQVDAPPDAVVAPRSEADVLEVVALCQEQRIPLVPSGGRSSVTRGLELPRGGICLDLTRHLTRVEHVSRTDLTARVQPGLYGPAYEAALNAQGFTCGHFPQSFEFSTVGGWVAARGAGQNSTYYGKAEDMVVALRCVTPRGLLVTRADPRSALGPDLTQIIVGSEGAYGVITEVTLRIWPHRPASMLPLCFMFRHFTDGVACMRQILQTGIGRPGVCRLSDPEETEVALTLDGLAGSLIDRGLQRVGYHPGDRALMLAATEGDAGTALYTAARAHAMAVKRGGLPLGPKPLRAWSHRRFLDPYLRDDLMDLGVLTDTLETAIPWSGLEPLRLAVREVIKSRPNTVALAHISHAYEQGANLYFIFLTPMDLGNELDDYRAFHTRIVDAIVAAGGALSHHHGVGRLFAPWFPDQVGPVGLGLIRALKEHLDPHDIMNPGVFGLT